MHGRIMCARVVSALKGAEMIAVAYRDSSRSVWAGVAEGCLRGMQRGKGGKVRLLYFLSRVFLREGVMKGKARSRVILA